MDLKQLYTENCEEFDEFMADGSCKRGLRMTLDGFNNALKSSRLLIEGNFTKSDYKNMIIELNARMILFHDDEHSIGFNKGLNWAKSMVERYIIGGN